MTSFPSVQLSLPLWASDLVQAGARYETLEDRMRLVIELAKRNIEHQTGGPFGAAIFERDTGRVVSLGVNMVERSGCSVAHAEVMAIIIAQQVRGTYDLGAPGQPVLELVTSAQPCIQCFGAVWWSGIRRLVTGAPKEKTETIAGFDEGPVPTDWVAKLRERQPATRAVEVVEGILVDDACEVLRRYREMGGAVY